MIIVEGPDGAGKSTLVEKLRCELSVSRIVQSNRPPRNAKDLEQQLKRSLDLVKQYVIQDRSNWISEPIYDLVRNGFRRIRTWPDYLETARLLAPTIIYCRPPNGVIRTYATKPSSPCDTPEYLQWISEHCQQIIQLYDVFMCLTKPALTYDWTNPGGEVLLSRFIQEIKKKGINK